jgi:hypothetical protein
MIQEVPYGTYIDMQPYSNDLNQLNHLNDLPISIVIVPNETRKVIENAIVHSRVFSCKCQIIIIFIMTLPVTLLLISVIIPKFL